MTNLPSASIVPVENHLTDMIGPHSHQALAVNVRFSAVDKKYHASCWVAGADGWLKSGPKNTLASAITEIHDQFTQRAVV